MNESIKIVQHPNDVLRAKARELSPEQIASPEIQQIITQMKQALSQTKYGVAIAAPQIGESVQIFLISRQRLFDDEQDSKIEDEVFINPKIVSHSKTLSPMKEGCLSVTGKYGTVPRYTKVAIKYLNSKGEKVRLKATSFLAHVFQHEIDHLNGILFIDKAQELFEVDEEMNIIRKIK